jgi:hypothetical protein
MAKFSSLEIGLTFSSSGFFVVEGELFAGILLRRLFFICIISLYSNESDNV